VLDIDFDVRISGVIGLGGGAGNQRLRIEEVPRGVLGALRAADADIGEPQVGRRVAREILRLLPYNGGSRAENEVRQVDTDEPPANPEIQSPASSHSEQGTAGPASSYGEVAEAERLLKSLASALTLRLLSRAATKTRQAIAGAKRAMKSKDAERIRQANERLREAATQLAGAMERVATATPT
jgi:hypothetical protein